MPLKIRPIPCLSEKDQHRFRSKVQASDDCWEWQGSRNDCGYGLFSIKGKAYPAHRVSLVLAGVELPTELVVDHLCRNPSCVNPTHLEPVTMRENTKRGISPIPLNSEKTHCPQGHPYDDENTYHYESGRICKACCYERREKLAPEQRKEMQARWQQTYQERFRTDPVFAESEREKRRAYKWKKYWDRKNSAI